MISLDRRNADFAGLREIITVLKRAPLSAQLGIVVVVIYCLMAVFAPLIAPYGEYEVISSASFAPWDSQFILGTDQLGRDFLSRLIYGARNSIGIALGTTILAFLIGVSLGIMSATLGGVVDQVLGRLVDALMSIPSLIFKLVLLAVFGSGIVNLILIIAVLDATRIYRVSRAASFNVVTLEFVEAARVRGEGAAWVVLHEILPNIFPIMIAEFGLRFCFVFLAIAALSFLGVGLQPPLAEWGSMVRDNAPLIASGDFTPLIPAFAIALLTVAVNFISDWTLNEASGSADAIR